MTPVDSHWEGSALLEAQFGAVGGSIKKDKLDSESLNILGEGDGKLMIGGTTC